MISRVLIAVLAMLVACSSRHAPTRVSLGSLHDWEAEAALRLDCTWSSDHAPDISDCTPPPLTTCGCEWTAGAIVRSTQRVNDRSPKVVDETIPTDDLILVSVSSSECPVGTGVELQLALLDPFVPAADRPQFERVVRDAMTADPGTKMVYQTRVIGDLVVETTAMRFVGGRFQNNLEVSVSIPRADSHDRDSAREIRLPDGRPLEAPAPCPPSMRAQRVQ